MPNYIQIKVWYDKNFRPTSISPTPLTANSTAELIVYLPINPGALWYTWITPGNQKVAERPLIRKASEDIEGYVAFAATIYPNMTSGLRTNDNGFSYLTIRSGANQSSKSRIPVLSSVNPEVSEIPQTVADELYNEIFKTKAYFEYDLVENFPLEGTTEKLYLAKRINRASEEEEEPVYEDYNMLHRWDAEEKIYIPIAGQGSGGGGGETSNVRVLPYPINSPTVLSIALGTELSLSFTYANSAYNTGSMMLYVNDVLKNTLSLTTGNHNILVSNYLTLGNNRIRISVVDPEGTTASLTYFITTNRVSISTTFNDNLPLTGTSVGIPYKIIGNANIRTMHFELDGVEYTKIVTANDNIETVNLAGLGHGAHTLKFWMVGGFLEGGVLSYEIKSNVIVLDLIKYDGISTTPIISSKFESETVGEGNTFSVDYYVFTPGQETSTVNLYIDNVLRQTTVVQATRQYWSLSLTAGAKVLKIESGSEYIEILLTVTPAEISFNMVDDQYLQLYLDAFGKSNEAANRDKWENLASYGSPVEVEFENVNWATSGWSNNYLRLVADAKATIKFQPFKNPLDTTGKTIEIDLTTNFASNTNPVLLQSFFNNIGLRVYSQITEFRGSNVLSVARYKEGEKISLSFVVSPQENMLFIYVNGIITGAASLLGNTNFQQLNPQDIVINPEGGDISIASIRYYSRALNSREVLNNYIVSLDTQEERISKYVFNDIYDDYGNPVLEKMANHISIFKIEGSPLPQSKIRPRAFVDVHLEHNLDPSRNFSRTGLATDIDAQGTSSLQYPIKNYKIRLDQKLPKAQRQKYEIYEGAIPERVFTLKADYMDSSHSHNTGLAKIADTMYNVGIPPKAFDPRVRTTVWGYPVALFHRLNSSEEWQYQGVYNFNLDKDAEDSVGLNNEDEWEEGNPDSVFPNNQSFEITFNADAGAGAFQDSDLGSIIASFEPRYPEVDEFNIFGDNNITPEELLSDTKDILTSWTSDAGLIAQIEEANYYEIVDIYDTVFAAQEEPEGVRVFRVLGEHYAQLKRLIDWVMLNHNSANFKAEFNNYLNEEYILKYLVFTLVFGLVDNLGKNAMFNTWDGQIWYPNFYDIDTALGLENQGQNIHNYDIEIGDPGTYATADSWLWEAVLNYYKTELNTTYSELRQGVLSYDAIMSVLYGEQISKISEAQYNTDSYAKYIGVTTAWLWMLQGNRLEHIKRWLTNRLAYLDGKFLYQTYIDDNVAIRINVPNGYLSAKLDLSNTTSGYLGTRWGNIAGGTIQKRTTPGVEHTLNAPASMGTGTITNMEVWIYGAQWLKSLGDITNLNPSSISIEKAIRLEDLIAGGELYTNANLTTVALGNNTQLKKIDLRGNINLGSSPVGTQVLDIQGADRIEEVYLDNTVLLGIDIAPGSNIKKLHIPKTFVELEFINNKHLSEIRWQGLEDLRRLRAENSLVPLFEIINDTTNLEYIRVVGLEFSTNRKDILLDAAEKIYNFTNNSFRVGGLTSTGATTSTPYFNGEVRINDDTLTNEEYGKLTTAFPGILFKKMSFNKNITLTDMGEYYEITKYTGTDTELTLPSSFNSNIISENPIYTYGFTGWKDIMSIGNEAFKNRTTITSIFIPSTVNNIGYGVFDGCTSLSSINIPPMVTRLRTNTFRNNYDLDLVYIPATVTTIEENTFTNNNYDGHILTSYENRPGGWDVNWKDDTYTVEWDRELGLKTFIFNTNGGIGVESIQGYLLSSIAPTSRYGYSLDKWEYNGNEITFPWIPPQESPTLIEIDAIWKLWSYNIRYYANDNSGNEYLYNDDFNVIYNQPFGPGRIPANPGTSAVSGVFKKWKNSYGVDIDETYIETRDLSSNGWNIDIYAQYASIEGLVFTFDNTNKVYNVIGWNAPSTSVPDGYYQITVPATFDNGVNGEHPVRNINYKNNNSTQRNKLGGLFIETNNLSISREISKDTPGYSFLTTMELPDNLTNIGSSAFANCSSLTSISIPSGVTNIGSSAFLSCSSLTSIIIPAGVTSIGMLSFRNCSSLTSITIPPGVAIIGERSFFGCSSLGEIIWNRPNISASQFYGTFAGFKEGFTFTLHPIQSNISIIDGGKGIASSDGEYLFAYPATGKSLDLTSYNFKKIGSVFSNNNNLETIILPDSLTSLSGNIAANEGGSFYGCSSLISITIPSGVTMIGGSTFRNCSSLEIVNLLPTIPPTLGISVFQDNAPGREFNVPSASLTAYQTATNWATYASDMNGV